MWAEVDVGINLLNPHRDGLNNIRQNPGEVSFLDISLMFELTITLEYPGCNYFG